MTLTDYFFVALLVCMIGWVGIVAMDAGPELQGAVASGNQMLADARADLF